MPTLYTQAESNIRRTWILIFGFLVFIIALGWLFSYLLNNPIFLIIAITWAVLQSFLSYWYSDKIVLALTRAKPIAKRDNPELYRVVENLCITAGLPLPRIYILNEVQPNAFATGRNEKQAVVVVTRGLLEKLEKPELEGVIAHELSHIGNKDMLLAAVVVILVSIIASLSNIFFRINFWREDRESRGSEGAILLALGLLAAILAPLAAILIQLSISRKREFLADASGVLLTRYPEGLIRALEKISADPNRLRVASNQTAHLYISSPFRGRQATNWLAKLFMTHPPIEDRIRALRELRM